MLSKEKLEQLLAILGDLTGEQKAIVIEALQKQIPDKDLFEKLEQLMAILGDLTEEQKTIVTEALNGPINEKELFGKLGVDEGRFTEFMQALAAQTEDAVLAQELSADEMDEAAGGGYCRGGANEASTWNCVQIVRRYIYAHKFPNCAATVEEGSWCGSNDACYSSNAVSYTGMDKCSRAWK